MRTVHLPAACPWLLLALLVSDAAMGARLGVAGAGKPTLDLSDLWKRGPLSLRSRAGPLPSLSMHNRDHMPSLSIVSPLDVLRDKMMQDIIERSIKNKIQANDKILKDLGKRSAPDDVAASLLRRDDDRSSFSPQESFSEELL
ncbi:corticotropin-releasing diuretic hormone 44 [Amblyomma americanum]